MLDPEVVSSCPDLQQRLLFSWNKVGILWATAGLWLGRSLGASSGHTVWQPPPLVSFQDKSSSEAELPSFRPYLLALLTHQSSWGTLHRCIRTLLSKSREHR